MGGTEGGFAPVGRRGRMFIAVAANRSRRPSGARCSERPGNRLSLGPFKKIPIVVFDSKLAEQRKLLLRL
jgi:hypothetical protein